MKGSNLPLKAAADLQGTDELILTDRDAEGAVIETGRVPLSELGASGLLGGGGGGSEPTIAVADASAMQVIIDAGSVKVGQLFKLASDGTLRRFEGGSNSRIIEKYYNDNPAGYARFVTTKGANLTNVIVNSTGATGWCYSVDGGSPTGNYFAGGYSNRTITIPAGAGVPHQVDIWPANSDTSGRVGDLTYLECRSNSLTSLDVSGLTSLANLYCRSNNLTSLDVSGLTSLTYLYCNNNSITSLDVSGLTALIQLSCNNNSITSLDVSGLTSLTYLYCNNNSITSLDVSGATSLTYLYCHNNSLTGLLDVSGATSLTYLYCHNNSLTGLLDVSGATSLTHLRCHNNSLTSLDVSGITTLGEMDCQNNSLTSITATGFDGAWFHGYGHHQGMKFQGNDLLTDAVYSMLDQMITANPVTTVELDGNPCEINNVLQDGVTYTAAQLSALATSKSLTLILN